MLPAGIVMCSQLLPDLGNLGSCLISRHSFILFSNYVKILLLLLGFCERNPGITRILHGDALLGESERLHLRVAQLFDRIETQLRTVLREAEMKERLRPNILLTDAAGLLLAAAEGRIAQFVRSGFKRSPTQGWEQQWSLLTAELMRSVQT